MNRHQQAPKLLSAHAEALEGQVALRLAAYLSRGAETLPHDISERLRFGRERALAKLPRRAAAVQRAPAAALWIGQAGPAAVMGGPPSIWLRLASLMPLVMLAAGLVMIQHHHELQQISVAAEIDSALLADDLPPDAYRDPGFGEFLRTIEAR